MKVKLAATVECILQLDDHQFWNHYRIQESRSTKRHVYLTLAREGAELMAGDLEARTGPGWDQPAAWVRSSRLAAGIIRAELAKVDEAARSLGLLGEEADA